MNVTLRNRQQQRIHMLSKISKIQFKDDNSVSKQLKNSIQYDSLKVKGVNKKQTCWEHLKQTKNTNPNPELLDSSKKVSKIRFIHNTTSKNLLEETSNLQFLINKKKEQLTHEDCFPHKMSFETAASTTISKNHSAQKAWNYTPENLEREIEVRHQLSNLKQKNSAYLIKWRNSASKITNSMRVILGEWLMQVALEIQIPKNAVYNAMHYLDKYVAMVHVPNKKYQQTGLCALFIASKLEISSHPHIDTYVEALDGTGTKQQIIELEKQMVLKLRFRLNPPTLYQYMLLVISLFKNFLKRGQYEYCKEIDLSNKSQFSKYLFWVLDGILLQDSYKCFHNKEKVCLSILYMCFKKQTCKFSVQIHKRYPSMSQNQGRYDWGDDVFEQFLCQIIRIFNKLHDLKQCLKVFGKWGRYNRREWSEEKNIEQLKIIILNK